MNPAFSLTIPYTLWGGLIGGALLSAASHGTDHLIVQRLLATRSLRDARVALIGSGIVVILQFALFLLVGVAIWAAGQAPDGVPGDAIFSRFIVRSLPGGLAGLVIAGILAAAMSSPISAMASAMTYDLYATWTGRRDPAHLLRVGHIISLVWGLLLIVAALGFHAMAATANTPAVVLALSIASVTYGALLGTYILAGRWPRARGRDVIGAVIVTVAVMLLVVFAQRLAAVDGLRWLGPIGRLAWPWYVPLGTLLASVTGILLSFRGPPAAAAPGEVPA
jgi:Na+/proline symporter